VAQLDLPRSIAVDESEFPVSPTIGERIDFVRGFLRRRYLTILIFLLLSLPFGALYLLITPSMYSASSTMMIEMGNAQLQKSLFGDLLRPDTGWIESQIGILKSANVAAYVVKQLHLAEDAKFIRSDVSVLDKLLARLGWGPGPEPTSEAERVGQAIALVMDGLEARRIGQSYMVQIKFQSHDREQAPKIANATIDAYIFDQLNAKYQASRRAGDWLQERLQALREQAAAAERAVIEFKAKNNIVAAGGTLINEKQLSEMSGQLAAARSHVSDLQARIGRTEAVRQAYRQDQPTAGADETISEALNDGIINQLRTRYLEYVNREAEWSTKYGKNHVAVVNLRNQIRDIRRSINDELGRIEQSYRSDYDIAKKRQDEMEKGLATLISQSQETNQAQVTPFSLEAGAKSFRKIYDDFLQQHTESVQQQSYPVSDARAISLASSGSKSYPRPLTVWMATIFAGSLLGFGFGALREIMDRGFRTREQVRSVLGTECLALIPLFTRGQSKAILSGWRRRKVDPRNVNFPKLLKMMVDAPGSLYAEAIRSARLNVDLKTERGEARVIGLASSIPHEGKSTVAATMATLIAQNGKRVVLVDCDVRNPTLSRALAPNAGTGVLEVIAGRANLEDAMWRDQRTHIAFLPVVANSALPHANELLASEGAKSLFLALKSKYDYVIVDLPPLVSLVDLPATARLIDSYVLVIEWGATKIDAVQNALRNAPHVKRNILGAVLNKVDVTALGRYDRYGATYQYGRHEERVKLPH
jgi:polysaccharide biosynthesis transport protein